MTKKTNRVILNIPLHPDAPLPEPDLPSLTIDGVEITSVQGLTIRSSRDSYTEVTICFHAEVGGFVGVNAVEDMIRKTDK